MMQMYAIRVGRDGYFVSCDSDGVVLDRDANNAAHYMNKKAADSACKSLLDHCDAVVIPHNVGMEE